MINYQHYSCVVTFVCLFCDAVRSMNWGTKFSSVVVTTKDFRHSPAETVCPGTNKVSSYLTPKDQKH